MAVTESLSARVTPGTLDKIKKFAHANGMSIGSALDEFAALIASGQIKTVGGHISLGNGYEGFEKAARDAGKDPRNVIAAVTDQLRRK